MNATTTAFNEYIETALWSSYDELTAGYLDSEFSISDFDTESLEQLRKEFESFMREAEPYIDGNVSRAARDFWLTQNRHGAGFWDGGWPEHEAELTELAKKYGERNLYNGDDGKVYLYELEMK